MARDSLTPLTPPTPPPTPIPNCRHDAAALAQENKAAWKIEFDSWSKSMQDRRVGHYKTKPKTGPLRATDMELAMMQCVARPNALHPPRAH